MPPCPFSGNADMYGLGIRIGFYLQWFGTIFASWLAPSEVPGMRFSNSLFVAATFLALIIQTVHHTLRPVETYIILLLTFGGYLAFVPLYLWRGLTCGTARLDPSRFPRVLAGPVYSVGNFGLLVAVSVFQLWFWFSQVNSVGTDGCIEYGFFFGKVGLNNKGFVVGNILLYFILLVVCVGALMLWIRRWARKRLELLEGASEFGSERSGSERSGSSDAGSISRVQKVALQELKTASDLIVASVVTIATEFTIVWNGIEDVGDISSAGQTIPLVIGIGLVIRIFYVNIYGDVDGEYRMKYGDGIASGIDFVGFDSSPSSTT